MRCSAAPLTGSELTIVSAETPGDRAQPLLDLAVEIRALLRGAVFLGRKRDRCGDQVRTLDRRLGCERLSIAREVDHDVRQKNHTEPELHRHERHHPASRGALPAGARAAADFQHGVHIGARGLHRRHEPEHEHGAQRDRGQRAQDPAVHRVVHPIRQDVRRNRRRENPRGGNRDTEAEHAGRAREDRALDQQLVDDAQPARAERRADRDLARAIGRARQHQVGGIGAGNQHDEKACGHERHPGRIGRPAEQPLIDGHHPCSHACVRLRVGRRHALRNRLDLASRVGLGDRVAQPAEDAEGSRVTALSRNPGHARQRQPDLGRAGKPRSVRKDADHRRGIAVDQNRAADQAPVASVARGPGAVAENHDRRRARTIVFVCESAADDRLHADGRKGVGGDVRRVETVGGAAVIAERDWRGGVGAHAGKAPRVRAKLVELRIGQPAIRGALVNGRDRQDAIGACDGEPAHGVRVNHREHHVVHADAKAEHENRRQREAAIPQQKPRGEARVERDILQARRDPHVPRPLARSEIVAERTLCGSPRVVRMRPTGLELRLRHPPMKGELLGQFLVLPAPPQEVPQAANQFSHRLSMGESLKCACAVKGLLAVTFISTHPYSGRTREDPRDRRRLIGRRFT